MTGSEFPRSSVVWPGTAVATIVNAVASARCPDYLRYMSWDSNSYVAIGGDGRCGAITFDRQGVVSVCFDPRSRYNTFPVGSPPDVEPHFRGMPEGHRRSAEAGALRYVRQTFDGKTIAVVTAAFWNDANRLSAAFPWDEVLQNGADLFRIQFIDDLDFAVEEWQDAYGLSPEQVRLARAICARRVAEPDGALLLAPSEVRALSALARDRQGLAEALRALAQVHVVAPLPEAFS